MAKFRKKARRFFGRVRRGYRRAGRGKVNLVNTLGASALWGAFRGDVANLAAPLLNKMPLQGYEDNLLFGAVGYFASKKGGIIGTAGRAVLQAEAFLVGAQVRGTITGNPTQSAISTVGGWI